MKRFFQCLSIIAVIATIVACDTNRIFDEYKKINNKSWNKDSLMVFTIPITDTLQNYNLNINIRTDIKYNYSNLWLFINITQPDGTSVKDTFEMALADASGKWLGKGMGGIKKRDVTYLNNIFFPVSGDYSISLQQGMRDENLEGITDIGIRIEKVK